MSFRHWADTRVRPYRRIMYAEYDRRVMYAEYDNRDMYAEYDNRVMYAEYDRRVMYVYEISHPSPLTSKTLMFNKKIYFSYEYRNKKEHLEADYSAHRVDSHGYCYHSWRYKLHGS